MAQPANTVDSYDLVGIREQLNDTINMISPEETPFYSKCKKTSATNTFHEWQTDALRASGANAHIEGDDTTATARTPTVRLGNYTQIVKDAARVSDTDEALNKAGRGRELVREIMKIGKELRLDIEKACFANNARVAGSSTVAREMAGVPAWLTTSTQGGSGAADPTGDGTDARTSGTNRTFTQTMLNTALESAWNAGGKPDTLYAATDKVTTIAGFTGSNNQRNTVDKRELSYAVDVYMTSFGTIEVQPSREIGANDMFVIESGKWEIAVARPFTTKDLAKTGDSTAQQVVTELTLCAKNEAANAGIYDLT
jgi:hypothetical protein